MSIPFSNVLFGRILDALNKDPGNKQAFEEGINVICVAFVVVGIIDIITGFTEVYCWSLVGERITKRFRVRYVEAILKQEIGWFDTEGAGQMTTKVC